MNTFIANELEEKLGDRPTDTSNQPTTRPQRNGVGAALVRQQDGRVDEVPVPTIIDSFE